MIRPLLVVLRPLGLGDFLTGIPAYRAIARHFPNHHRVLAAPHVLHGLVAGTGAFDCVCDVAALEPLPGLLHDADIAIDLHGRGPASQRILRAARPRRLIAFAHDEIPESAFGARWIENEREIDRWCRMLAVSGIEARPSDLHLERPPSREARLHDMTVVHPGAGRTSRRWPIDRWTDVVRSLQREGHEIALTGSLEDAPLTAAIASRTRVSASHDLAGATSLSGLSALVAHARLVLSSETDIARLAVAHGTPSITLFGDAAFARQDLPASAHHRVLRAGSTGDPTSEMADRALLGIEVEHVLAAVRGHSSKLAFR